MPTLPELVDGHETSQKLFSGYISVWERKTRKDDRSPAIDWHVAGVNGPAPHAVGTTTLIHEYAQGPHRMTFSLPAGRTGEKTALEAGMHELSEEVQLKAPEDRWQLLGPDKGVPEGKWITSICRPLLVLDPEIDAQPRPTDAEEDIEVIRDVPLSRVKELILQGEMLVASTTTVIMAVEWLKANGHAEAVAKSGW